MIVWKRNIFGILKYAAIFLTGGSLYAVLELVYRGRTHWSMLLAGGLCAVLLYLIAVKNGDAAWKKWIMGGVVITTVEFITGVIVNIMLDWNVWSYAHSWGNLFGQICLLFALLWILLSIPGIWVMELIGRRIFRDGRGGFKT